jgi:hypothetical protein
MENFSTTSPEAWTTYRAISPIQEPKTIVFVFLSSLPSFFGGGDEGFGIGGLLFLHFELTFYKLT